MSPLPEPEPPVEGCKKCGLFGCECDAPQVISPFPAFGPLADERAVCAVCRRAKMRCICISHVDLPRVPVTHSGDPVPAKSIDDKVNEGMALYYQRDAVGLQRFLRDILKSPR